jgi:hypothetical protein
MSQDSTYQQKFAMLKLWMPVIAGAVKKDLKNEHLKQSGSFAKRYFPSKNIAKLTVEELGEGYGNAIQNDESGEAIGEWLAQRWLLKKSDLYLFFETKLSEINPKFDEIKEIEKAKADEIIKEAIQNFGAQDTYLFSVINAVVFPSQSMKNLAKEAEKNTEIKVSEKQTTDEDKSIAKLMANHEQQIARLTDKYEKKLQGFERKYLCDTEGLKKQISLLQRRLNADAGV